MVFEVMPWYYQAQQSVGSSVPQTPTAATTLTPVLLPAPPVGIWPQQQQQLASPQDPPQQSIFTHAMYAPKNLLLNGMQPGNMFFRVFVTLLH